MKTVRVVLTFGGPTFIEADRYTEEDGFVRFFRGDHVQAHFPKASILKLEETTPGNGPFSQWLSDGKLPPPVDR
jgi:hypothetical protein